MLARRAIKIDLSSLSSEPLLGSASASLHALWPAVMLQYSMQIANPFLFPGQRGHDDAIRGCDAESSLWGFQAAMRILFYFCI